MDKLELYRNVIHNILGVYLNISIANELVQAGIPKEDIV
jgi:hypothetical protein